MEPLPKRSPAGPGPAPPPPAGGPRPAVRPAWRSGDILRAAALVFGLYLALQLLWFSRLLVLTAFLGVLFGLAVARGADYLERLRIPRGLGAPIIVFGFLGLLYGVGAWSAPTLAAQFGELRARLPEATDKVEGWLNAHRDGFLGRVLDGAAGRAPAPAAPAAVPPPAAPAKPRAAGHAPTATAVPAPAGAPGAPPASAPMPGGPSDLRATLAEHLGSATRFLFPFLSSTVEVLAGLLLILFISIFIGIEPDTYHRGLLALFPHPVRRRAGEVLSAISVALRKWLETQAIAMLTIGVVVAIALKLLGIKAALSLGIIAGLFEFIPTVGPILSAIPGIAMAFLESPQKAFAVALVYWGVQMLEGHILIPMLMKEGMDLPPVLTIIGQALMALVFGFLGLLLAVPLIAAVIVAVKMLYVEDVVGDAEVTPSLDG
jgi:predicted PurR-regulated permease PerM